MNRLKHYTLSKMLLLLSSAVVDINRCQSCRMLSRDQFIEQDAAVVTQVFKYTMNVLHAAIAVQSERQLKLQTEVGRVLVCICC